MLHAFDPTLERCPWAYITDRSWALLDAWQRFKLFGLYPYPGDAGDQPAWLLDAWAVIESAKAQFEAEQIPAPQENTNSG